MIEDTPHTSQTLTFFIGVPQSSSADKKSIFIHPSDTEAPHRASVQESLE